MSKIKLGRAQEELLHLLASGERTDITDESIVRALERKGLAERHVDRHGHLANRHSWRITPAGRSALSASTSATDV